MPPDQKPVDDIAGIDHTPRSIRSANASGNPAALIFRAASKWSYGTRKNVISSFTESKIAYAAAGFPSRGCPALPTIACHRRCNGTGTTLPLTGRNGAVFPVDLSVSEVNVDGTVTFTGLVRDITERKRLEREVLDVSEREQRRIGYELHDGVCQELALTRGGSLDDAPEERSVPADERE